MKCTTSLKVALCCFRSFFARYLCESVASWRKDSTKSGIKSSAKSAWNSRPISKTTANASPADKRTSKLADDNSSDNCDIDLRLDNNKRHYYVVLTGITLCYVLLVIFLLEIKMCGVSDNSRSCRLSYFRALSEHIQQSVRMIRVVHTDLTQQHLVRYN